MTDIALAAACYLALLLASCYAVAALLDVMTSPQAVQALGELTAGIGR